MKEDLATLKSPTVKARLLGQQDDPERIKHVYKDWRIILGS